MSMDEKTEKTNQELKCRGCGAVLQFSPGTTNLKCIYCGAENPIEASSAPIEEIDYEAFLRSEYDKEEKIEVASVKCKSCGAFVTLKPNVTSDDCPYCASSIVISGGSTSKVLKPKSVLPFKVEKKQASQKFQQWIKGLWFAPNALKKNTANEKIDGIYTPYWTYDSDTFSHYTGERGDYYYVTETYTTTENGQTVTKTRQVRKTRWTPVNGSVSVDFDDILVVASHSLPGDYVKKLEPWNLSELLPYDDKFLSGFRSETYQVDVTTGLTTAKSIMSDVIYSRVRSDIGGDEQRVNSVQTQYSNISFKHILLPIWISAYRFRDKVFRFLVNGQTGEVQGERPYSGWKIFFTILVAAIIIVTIIVLLNNK